MKKHAWTGWLARLAAALAFGLPLHTHAALVLDGPATVVPGQTFTLGIGLDAALVAEIDYLMLGVQFDPAVTSQNAAAGALLASGSFLANAAAGTATHSFLATLAQLGPGVLATWTLAVDPTAVAGTTTALRATLETLVIDDTPTAMLSAGPLTIAVVPEPSAAALLLAGLAFVAGLAALRKR